MAARESLFSEPCECNLSDREASRRDHPRVDCQTISGTALLMGMKNDPAISLIVLVKNLW